MAFYTIEVVPNLDEAGYAQATSGQNSDLDQITPTADRLEEAEFEVLEERDATADYLHTVRRWLEAAGELEEGLRATLSDEVYEERVRVRREGMELTEAGLHRRVLYVAE